MASQSNGPGFAVPGWGIHEVLACVLQSIGGLYPASCGIEARTGASLFLSIVRAHTGAQLYRQTYNLPMIYCILLAWLVCMSVFVQFTHTATHNTYS